MNLLGKKNFNDLLTDKEINPSEVVVLRHCPWTKKRYQKPDWLRLVGNKPELFNEYQQAQENKGLVDALSKEDIHYVAAFIGPDPREAVFVGLYKIGKTRKMKRDDFWKEKEPTFAGMEKLGIGDYLTWFKKETVHLFELSPVEDLHQDLKGRLVIGWRGAIAWWRYADRNEFPILPRREKSAFA